MPRLRHLTFFFAVAMVAGSGLARAGGSAVSDAGATRIGMYAVMGKVSDPTAIFHNVANIGMAESSLQINASALAGFATAQFQIQTWDFATGESIYDSEGEPVDSETSEPDLNYGAFPYFGITHDFGLKDKGWNFGFASYLPNLTGGSIDEDSEFRYHIVRGFFITNYNSLAVSKRIGDKLILGASLDFVYALQTAKLYFRYETVAGYDPTFVALVQTLGLDDLKTNLTVDDTKWTYHLGLTYMPAENVTLGITYFERVNFKLEGDITLRPTPEDAMALSALGIDQDEFKTTLTQGVLTPRAIKFGMNFVVNPKWNWGFDFYWWDFSKDDVQTRGFPNLEEDFGDIPIIGPVAIEALGDGLVSPRLYQDSYQVNLGAEHIVNEKWKLRFGVSYDESPIPNQTFTIDALTSDSYSAAVGFEYKVNERNYFGFGFQHIIFKTRTIRDSLTDPPTNGEIVTSFTDSVMLEWNYKL